MHHLKLWQDKSCSKTMEYANIDSMSNTPCIVFTAPLVPTPAFPFHPVVLGTAYTLDTPNYLLV